MIEAPVVRLFIEGVPVPGGSKQAFVPLHRVTKQPFRSKKTGRIVVNVIDDAGERNKQWKKAVNLQAFQLFKEKPWACPISVEFHFVMPRPKHHYGTGKNAERLKDDAPMFPAYKPDTTKLIRSTEDALTGRLWVDDAQIVFQVASKSYGRKPGVTILMRDASCETRMAIEGPIQTLL